MNARVGVPWQPAAMGEELPFIGSEALTSGRLSRYELRRYYRAIMPNVYLDKRVEPSLSPAHCRGVSVVAAGSGRRWTRRVGDVRREMDRRRLPDRVDDDAIARLDALAQATDFKVSGVEELAARHRHTCGLRRLETALDLMDAGAESPKETWLRLLVIRAGFPRPRTQIPVQSPDCRRWYYLDMGWEDLMLAVEYDGDHHRTD